MNVTRCFLAGLALFFVFPLAEARAAGQKRAAEGTSQDKLLRQLAARVQHLEDVIEIQTLQAQYGYFLFTQNYAGIVERCFAKRASGIEIEFSDSGVYKGVEGVRRLFKAFEENKNVPGFFTLHMTVDPYIVIAKDGQSARSVWLSPGATANSAKARWVWGPYYVDYVREDGKWRIKRSVFAPLFRNEFEKSWLESTDPGTVTRGLSSKPDGPPSIYRPFDKNKTNLFKDYPALPEPY